MPSMTINIAPGSLATAGDVIDLFDWMIDATLSNNSSTSLQLSGLFNGDDTVVTVTGVGLTYGSDGGGTFLTGGTITGFSVLTNGEPNGSVVTNFDAADYLAAADLDFSGTDIFAIENFYMGFDITYNGGDGEDYLPAGSVVGDGADFNLRGNDILNLNGGNDVIYAGDGNDTVNGGDGDDEIDGGAGADAIDGGAGFDFVMFWTSASGVNVNLATGVGIGGTAQGDTYANIEGINGTDFGDTLTGDEHSNALQGHGGDDIINGGGAADFFNDYDYLDGGAGNDQITVIGLGDAVGGEGDDRIIGETSGDTEDGDFVVARYDSSTSGIVANLTATSHGGLAGGDDTNGFRVQDGLGGVDLVSGVHVLRDSGFDDTFYVDSTWTNSFGNWIEILLTAGDDHVEASGVNVASVNYARADGAVHVDLAAGTATDLNPSDNFIGNDTFTGVNRARGTSFDDILDGSAGNDQLRGRGGADIINGGNGNDVLFGDERSFGLGGADTIHGGAGDDIINGGGVADFFGDSDFLAGDAGNDTITAIGLANVFGGLGDDRIIGVTSGDTDNGDFIRVQYDNSTSGIVANLTATMHGGLAGGDVSNGFRIQDGLGGVDLVSEIHAINDSDHNDTFYIDSTWTNSFGNWVEIYLSAGDDHVEAEGVNVAGVNYARAGGAVHIDLAAGTATDLNPSDNFIGDDTFTGVNRARGTSFDDLIDGSGANEHLRGRAGNDTINGGGGDDQLFGDERSPSPGGGNDTINGGDGDDVINGGGGADAIDGGDGIDVADLSNSGDAVTVNLTTGTGTGGDAEGDTYVNIENVWGSFQNDTLTGDNQSNYLGGLDGDDILNTGAFDINTVATDFDFLSGENGNDTLNAFAAADMWGGAGDDRIIGHATGPSDVNGDGNYQRANYRNAASGITANLTATTHGPLAGGDNTNGYRVADGDGGTDLISGVIGVVDSNFNDQFFVDSSYVSHYGSWVEITLGMGDDDVVFGPGLAVARINYKGAGGGVLADIEAGTATDINPGDDFIGHDTFSGVNFFRGSNFDDQITAANAGTYIRGARGSDLLIGGTGADTLDGDDFGGNPGDNFADTMRGGAGNDIYYVNNLGDVVDEAFAGSSGFDTVYSSVSVALWDTARFQGAVEMAVLLGTTNLSATGNSLNNVLEGNSGANAINGGTGADIMRGMAGNDTYTVDNAGDVVDESVAGSGGFDSVQSTVSLNLSDTTHVMGQVEMGVLLGSANLNLAGNALNNLLIGNAGANAINGGTGADIMRGMAGNDTYVVDNAADVVDEAGGAGFDRVHSTVSLDLSDAAHFMGQIEMGVLLGSANLNLIGNSLNNLLIGNAGSNVVNGGTGADTMRGMAGNDTYYIDNVGDVVDETGGSGFDRVHSTVSIGLWDTTRFMGQVEMGVLLGSANINLAGNGLNNLLIGNSGANAINGGAGADTMRGLAGNDTYTVDNAGDVVDETGGAGFDRVHSTVSIGLWDTTRFMGDIEMGVLLGSANINLAGNGLNNLLIGNSGANAINGGAGADIMRGMAGNDTYYVDNAGDVVDETGGAGFDRVHSTISLNLSDATHFMGDIEMGVLLGSANLNLIGNSLNNLLIGNTGSNVVNGGTGADTMRGMAGNDTYYVDNAGDVVDETGGAGFDRVHSTVSIGLWDTSRFMGDIEMGVLLGSANLDLAGNGLNNLLIGNAGANDINGGVGNDTLTGGAGADTFAFTTALNGATNVDNITDFNVAADTIRLENAVFTGLAAGVLAASAFHTGAAAADASDRIVYDSATGALSFDADGLGGVAAVQFAHVTAGLALTNADFVVV